MLYINIIFRCLNEAFSSYLIQTLVILLILFISIILTWFNIKKTKSYNKYLIVIIRLILATLILPLLIDKNFNFKKEFKKKQNIGIFLDNSKSVKINLEKQNIFKFNTFFSDINSLSKTKNFKVNYYDIESEISINKVNFPYDYTSYDYFTKIINKDSLDQFILISDGNVNKGVSDFSLTKKIHVIGLGNQKQTYSNIKILDVSNSINGDSTLFKIYFEINLPKKSEEAIIKLETNDSKELIFVDTLIFKKGNYFFNKTLNFKTDKFLNNYLVNLELINSNEINTADNSWFKKIEKLDKKNILLLTGKISYNTGFIKKIINNINGINFKHQIVNKLNKNLSFQNYDYIILDNFPHNTSQIKHLKKFVEKKQKLIFLEGVGNSSIIINKTLDLMFNNDISFINSSKINSKIKFFENFSIGPVNKGYKVLNKNDKNKVVLFDDKSTAIIHNENFCAILIPNISVLDFYEKNKYSTNKINDYFKDFFVKALLNKNNINLKVDRNSFYRGEKLSFNFTSSDYLDKNNIIIYLKNIKENKIDSIFYLNNKDIFLDKKGDFEIFLKIDGTNNNLVTSNIEKFSVINKNIENDIIFQNVDFLKNISKLSNGEYVNSLNYNIDYLKNINFSSINTINREVFNSLDIFIKDLIYLYVIILFSLEIYLRKKIGLM